MTSLTCVVLIVSVLQLIIGQQCKNAASVGCQTSEHVCERAEGQSTGLLHQQGVLIACLRAVLRKRGGIKPRPLESTRLGGIPDYNEETERMR